MPESAGESQKVLHLSYPFSQSKQSTMISIELTCAGHPPSQSQQAHITSRCWELLGAQ
jgi:hypothetical protein